MRLCHRSLDVVTKIHILEKPGDVLVFLTGRAGDGHELFTIGNTHDTHTL